LDKRTKEISLMAKEKDAAEEKLHEVEAAKEREVNNEIAEMNSQWSLFNQGLEIENWEKAQELWSKLDQEKHPQ
jgi:hypothetical protein